MKGKKLKERKILFIPKTRVTYIGLYGLGRVEKVLKIPARIRSVILIY
jgi:hypothetical protein